MDLRTHYPYSLLRYGLTRSYPSLKKNRKTDVAIMGAGITGALTAWHLQQQGIDCIVADKRHVATGSTAASTSLIQYEIDVPLHELVNKVGYDQAIRSYELSLEAIGLIENICNKTGSKDIFEKKCSLQYASSKQDVNALKKEYDIRRQHGFDVELLTARDVKKQFHFDAPGAMMCSDAGQLDAYKLTHNLLGQLSEGSVFDHTEITNIDRSKNGVELKTKDGFNIKAKHLVIACGYESGRYMKKNKWEELRCTYAILSEPLPQEEFWKDNCLIWETADPYLYIRTCDENRLLIGGKDTAYFRLKQQVDALPQKAKALQKAFEKKFPHLPIKIDFSWAGAFATTKDGLPYIGQLPDYPHTFFALGYGGNGITFSLIAARQITAAIKGEKQADMELFSFHR